MKEWMLTLWAAKRRLKSLSTVLRIKSSSTGLAGRQTLRIGRNKNNWIFKGILKKLWQGNSLSLTNLGKAKTYRCHWQRSWTRAKDRKRWLKSCVPLTLKIIAKGLVFGYHTNCACSSWWPQFKKLTTALCQKEASRCFNNKSKASKTFQDISTKRSFGSWSWINTTKLVLFFKISMQLLSRPSSKKQNHNWSIYIFTCRNL